MRPILAIDNHPKLSLFLFWLAIPAVMLTIVVFTQVQNSNQANKTQALTDRLDERVTQTLCQLTQGAWLERGRIIDGLVLATIGFVEANPQAGVYYFLRTFREYHALLQSELQAVKPCPQG